MRPTLPVYDLRYESTTSFARNGSSFGGRPNKEPVSDFPGPGAYSP